MGDMWDLGVDVLFQKMQQLWEQDGEKEIQDEMDVEREGTPTESPLKIQGVGLPSPRDGPVGFSVTELILASPDVWICVYSFGGTWVKAVFVKHTTTAFTSAWSAASISSLKYRDN